MKNAFELLVYSLDNELTKEEQRQLNAALLASPELQKEKEEYIKMREIVSDISFSENPHFIEKTMQQWAAQKSGNNFNNNIVQLFPRVAAAAAILFLFAWSVIYFSGGNIVSDTLLLVGDVSPDEAYSLLEY
ncbi:MAG TPA: hypothetical protein ENJ95_17280 [Bacteroidetes bacterium]|nr:hypothetical protein [Bacteroidota bacterium]